MRIALITGASSGIGKQFAESFEKECSVDELWAIARDEARLEELKRVVSIPVKTISVDLAQSSGIELIRRLFEKERPEISLLINASGFGKFSFTCDVSIEDSIGMVDLNVRALTAMTLISMPYLCDDARIINIASVAAGQPVPGMNIYAASKAYVLSFTRSLNEEFKIQKKGIRAMAVCPFWTKTRFFNRAVDDKAPALVKKYVVMYEPGQIVSQAWRDLKKGKTVSIFGFVAKGQWLLVKLLPHSLVMKVWRRQQKLG